jgi:hypothetical protein
VGSDPPVNIYAHSGSCLFSSHFAIFILLHPRLTFFLCCCLRAPSKA